MSTEKILNKKRLEALGVASIVGTLAVSKDAQAGGEPGGAGEPGYTGMNEDDAQQAVEDAADGLPPGSYEADVDGDGVADYDVDVYDNPEQMSTPFLAVWDGKKFVHENDFLFGKPQTAFANYDLGVKAYSKGIGGDTYLLSDTLRADQNGKLKMQIRELEPEESYIDKFSIEAIDLKPTEHFVVDGNLEDSYVFDTEEARSIDGEMHHYHAKKNISTTVSSSYTTLKSQAGDSITLETEDVLVIKVPKTELSTMKDTFILVDSHFRDWTLGEQVPFSRLERFVIQSASLGKKGTTAIAGIAALVAMAFIGSDKNNGGFLEKLLSVPYTYADYVIGKSLVITAGSTTDQTHLQTLFPRYVQAAQEVVRIPKEIIANLKEEFLTLRIRATKKHKVLAAFVFQGTPRKPGVSVLSIEKITNAISNKDYAEQLNDKNGTFLHTIPGDILDVVVKDAPKVVGMTRRYVLRANGFYTRMSAKTASKIGNDWLNRLNPEDRILLKNLRLS